MYLWVNFTNDESCFFLHSLMEALSSGSAFSRERPRKKANPRVAGGKS